MNCNQCGAENNDQNKFCNSCGKILELKLGSAQSKSNIYLKFMIIVAPLLVIISFWLGTLYSASKVNEESSVMDVQSNSVIKSETKDINSENLSPKVQFIALDPFTVNLADNDQYLQIGFSLKFMNPLIEGKIIAYLPEIRSKALAILTTKNSAELLTENGKKLLVEKLLSEINSVIGFQVSENTTPSDSDKNQGVIDILFTSFIIQ